MDLVLFPGAKSQKHSIKKLHVHQHSILTVVIYHTPDKIQI